MLRKSKHKCYEILNVKEKFGRGDEKRKVMERVQEWKS